MESSPRLIRRRLPVARHEQYSATQTRQKSNPDYLRVVSSYLTFKDLLGLRLVCRDWNELICARDPKTQDPGPLLRRTRLFFEGRRSKVNKSKSKSQVLMSRFANFSQISLITEFHVGDYHFRCLDLRFEIVWKFLQHNGKYIENLLLENCILSLVTFQRILQACPNLQSFDIRGMFHCVCHTETIFGPTQEVGIPAFKNLKKLYFESTYVARLQKQKILNSTLALGVAYSPHDTLGDELKVQDLHPMVIREILHSARMLESITISGFGMGTVNAVLRTLSRLGFHNDLTELCFYNTPHEVTSICLSELDEMSHMQLKKFALTFLPSRRSRDYELDYYENFDKALRKILIGHQSSLEVLDLRNCKVTEAIFSPAHGFQLPFLRKLVISGTGISELSEESQIALREFLSIYQSDGSDGVYSDRLSLPTMVDAITEPPPLVEESCEILKETEPTTSVSKRGFSCCSNFDAVCMVLVGVLALAGAYYLLVFWKGESTGTTLFMVLILLLFNAYAFYFVSTYHK